VYLKTVLEFKATKYRKAPEEFVVPESETKNGFVRCVTVL
jgi:hypothetical protein